MSSVCSATESTSNTQSRKLTIFRKQHCTPSYTDLFKDRFLDMLNTNQFMMVAGAPGCGKSAEIPQYCAEWNLNRTAEFEKPGIVACTEPKRIATIAAATKVAEELNVQLGEEVDYDIRFENRNSEKTILKYCTDGMLVRETMINPELNGYGVIVMDETHERTLATDVLLSLRRKIVETRSDIKIVVISVEARETERFQKFLDDCPILFIPSASHPVEIIYSPKSEKDYIEAAVRTVLEVHRKETYGDILLFLPGPKDVETACKRISEKISSKKYVRTLNCIPLHSNLPLSAIKRYLQSRAAKGTNWGKWKKMHCINQRC